VDLDGDGHPDVLSGCWTGEIFFFAGRPGGQFAECQPLRDSQNRVVRVDYASTVSTVDWNGSGCPGLLLGSSKGHVYWIPNQGTRQRHSFGEPIELAADDKPILAPERNSCPVAADWDGDGLVDLLFGAGDGSVCWARNVGTAKQPKFAAPQQLVPPPKPGDERGTYAKICVTDFNQDGRLDLLVGDRGGEFDKELSEEETRWREQVRAQRAALLEQWAGVFRRYRELLQTPPPAAPAGRQEHQRQLEAAREQLQQISAMRENFGGHEQLLTPGKQRHGRIWLFLRQPY
jgi:hypothetical protein